MFSSVFKPQVCKHASPVFVWYECLAVCYMFFQLPYLRCLHEWVGVRATMYILINVFMYVGYMYASSRHTPLLHLYIAVHAYIHAAKPL